MDMSPRKHIPAARGFSLLELMLVLAILAVLTAVVAFNMSGSAAKAKATATKTSMGTIKSALDSYQLDYNAYPPELRILQMGARPVLDPTKPLKDGWDRDYFYSPQPYETNVFQLISLGEDGQASTPDDINVWTMHLKKP